MTEPGEERCRELLSKLVRNCGWHVRSWTAGREDVIHKLVSSENWYLHWEGTTWTNVWRQLLMDLEYARLPAPPVPRDPPPGWFRDALPAWLRGCGSEEELVLRAEALP